MQSLVQVCLEQDCQTIERELSAFAHEVGIAGGAVADGSIAQSSFEINLGARLDEVLRLPGKRVRPLLAHWLIRNSLGGEAGFERVSAEAAPQVSRVAACVEILHGASLLIDDIEDGSMERRGRPAFHVTHGVPVALNTGSWLYFAALKHLRDPHLMQIGIDVLFDCHIGQGLDIGHGAAAVIDAVFHGDARDRAQYYQTCARLKTARLMEFVARAGGRCLGLEAVVVQRLTQAFTHYGAAFQILDDLKNFVPSLSGAKTFEDLDRGIRNHVCLELLNLCGPSEREIARWRSHSGDFREFVLSHAQLETALQRSLAAAESSLESAARALSDVCKGDLSRSYLRAILDKPLVEMRSAMEVPLRGQALQAVVGNPGAGAAHPPRTRKPPLDSVVLGDALCEPALPSSARHSPLPLRSVR